MTSMNQSFDPIHNCACLVVVEKIWNINNRYYGCRQLLLWGILKGKTFLPEKHLSNNADKTKIDNKGKTAFEYAAFSGNEQIINLLK